MTCARFVVAAALLVPAAAARQQEPPPSENAPASTPPTPFTSPTPRAGLALAGQIELARLVDLSAERLHVNIEYDATVLKGNVTLRLGGGVSDGELWELTNRILAARGFTTVRTRGDGTLSVVRIADAAGLARVMLDGANGNRDGPAQRDAVPDAVEVVPQGFTTTVVRLQHRPAKEIVEAVKLVLSKSAAGGGGGSASALGDSGLLLLSDLTPHVEQAMGVLALLDTPQAEVVIEEVPTRFLSPAQLAASATQIATKRQTLAGEIGSKADAGASGTSPSSVSSRAGSLRGEVLAAPGGSSVLVVAPQSAIENWKQLLSQIDQREGVETVSYSPRNFGIKDVAKLIEQVARDSGAGGAGGAGSGASTGSVVGSSSGSGAGSNAGGDERWRLITDELTGTLIVTATPGQHEKVRELLNRLDSVPAGARRPMRTFVVRNRPVTQVVEVLSRLIDAGALNAASSGEQGVSSGPSSLGASSSRGVTLAPSGSVASPSAVSSGPPDRSNDGGNSGRPSLSGIAGGGSIPPSGIAPGSGPRNERSPSDNTPSGAVILDKPVGSSPFLPAGESGRGGSRGSSAGGGASIIDRPITLTADEGTNSIIAIGEPRLLAQVETLLVTLDVRQPQVMLEVMLVSLNDAESLNLGIELERIATSGGSTIRLASLFGLSSGGANGTRTVGDAAGFTGSVLNPGEFSLIVRALQGLNKGRSLSQPRVLVNNNEQAVINATLQQPFATTSNSSTTNPSTTSFGGTSSAGTVLTIKPQIGQGDHLLLTYDVSLSSFVGNAANSNLPPPRQENSVQSSVTIPDGYTVVVGGLELESDSKATSQIPLLGDIPILGEAFKTRNNSTQATKFYVFIRAAVLRDSSFEDLKYLSNTDVARPAVDDGFPEVEARVIR